VATPLGVFISYAHRDGASLAVRLAQDLGANNWIDISKLRAGDIWEREIESALDAAEVVLALLSPGSYASEICRAEQMRALRKGKCVIALLALPCDFPLHFETRQYLDFTSPAAYPGRFETLLEAIRFRRGNPMRGSRSVARAIPGGANIADSPCKADCHRFSQSERTAVCARAGSLDERGKRK
jgi:hypothetical protein